MVGNIEEFTKFLVKKFQGHKIDDGIYSTPQAQPATTAPRAKSKQAQQPRMNPGVQDEIIPGGGKAEEPPQQQQQPAPGARPKRSAAKQVNYMEDEVYATPAATTGRRRK